MVPWAHASLLPLAAYRSVQAFCRAYAYVQTPYHGTRNSSSYHQLRRIRQVRRLVGHLPLNSWFQHSFYRHSTSATHCCLVCQGQPFSPCSVWWMQRLESSWTCRCATMWSQLWCSYIGCRLSKKSHTSCMSIVHTGQAPQYLSDCVSTVSALSGRYRLRSTGSADYVLPRTITRFGERGFFCCGSTLLFLPTSTTLPTPVNSENDSRVYFLIVLTTDYCWRSWTCRIAAP